MKTKKNLTIEVSNDTILLIESFKRTSKFGPRNQMITLNRKQAMELGIYLIREGSL